MPTTSVAEQTHERNPTMATKAQAKKTEDDNTENQEVIETPENNEDEKSVQFPEIEDPAILGMLESAHTQGKRIHELNLIIARNSTDEASIQLNADNSTNEEIVKERAEVQKRDKEIEALRAKIETLTQERSIHITNLMKLSKDEIMSKLDVQAKEKAETERTKLRSLVNRLLGLAIDNTRITEPSKLFDIEQWVKNFRTSIGMSSFTVASSTKTKSYTMSKERREQVARIKAWAETEGLGDQIPERGRVPVAIEEKFYESTGETKLD